MDFDEGAADRLIAACDEAVAVLDEQRGPRASVTAEALAEFRGPFAESFRRNSAAQSAARISLVSALEDVKSQVRFAKARAEEARRELKAEQEKARWFLSQGQDLVPGVETFWARILGLGVPEWFAESQVRRPEVAIASIRFEPHEWTADGGAGTSSAVPDALERAAALFARQGATAGRVYQEVVEALGRFQGSCSWVLSHFGAFAVATARSGMDDREDAEKLRRIADAFRVAGHGSGLAGTVSLSTTTLAVALEHESGINLLKFLSTATPRQMQARTTTKDWDQALEGMPPELVSGWWAGLGGNAAGPGARAGLAPAKAYSVQQQVLLGAAPKMFGSLDGVPALARVYANQLGVVSDLEAAEKDLVEVRTFSARNSVIDKKREAFLASEIAYLKAVQSGDVQLYSYDRGQSRIVEMIGTPGQDARRVVTYVPGTFTSLKSFYDGGTQGFSRYLVGEVPGTVAFVYKDGIFPGEDTRTGGGGAFGLAQANDPKLGLESGEKSARFQKGMQSDPLLRGAEQVGIGHSWGYQNLTSSEIYGAEYEKSISLSGAGMHEKWVPDAETLYANFVYEDDTLLKAQGTGLVWDGKVPNAQESFVNHYYARSEGEGGSIDSHSLIALDSQENDEVLEDVKKLVEK